MIETTIDKWKITERKTKENVEKITKKNNSTLNLRQAEWTKKSTDENKIKFYRVDRITIESTFSVTNTARAERKRWHSTIYESIYLYLISSSDSFRDFIFSDPCLVSLQYEWIRRKCSAASILFISSSRLSLLMITIHLFAERNRSECIQTMRSSLFWFQTYSFEISASDHWDFTNCRINTKTVSRIKDQFFWSRR
jgi:hypothetical protein